MDGLFVFHNPFAKHPLPPGVFDHDRIAQMTIAPDGEVLSIAPSDFLLSRMLSSFVERDA
jgi:hypothetical protein